MDNGDGTMTGFFGYRNDNPYNVAIAVGVNNQFFPSPLDRGQPTLFLPGQHDSVFSITFDAEEVGLLWRLDGRLTGAWLALRSC